MASFGWAIIVPISICAGALVDNTLRRCTQRLRCPAGTAPRVCVFQVGNHRFQAVYSPWVGKWDSQRHRDFLSSVTANHVALRHSTEADDTYVWTFGDFNLHGVAAGPSTKPKPGSKDAGLVAWFLDDLASKGLRAQDSPATHRAGGALDLHITLAQDAHDIHVAPLSNDLSDHALTHVSTPMHATPSDVAPGNLPDRFVWVRDTSRWATALKPLSAQAHELVAALDLISLAFVSSAQPTAPRKWVLNLAVASLDVVFVTAGHLHELCVRSSRRLRPSPRACAALLVASQKEAYNLAEARARSNPDNPEAQAEAVLAWAWLEQVSLANNRASHAVHLVHPGFAKAAAVGPCALQRWLTRASSHTKVTLQINSQEQAQELLCFRASVGQLDSRCCAASERKSQDLVRIISGSGDLLVTDPCKLSLALLIQGLHACLSHGPPQNAWCVNDRKRNRQ